MASKREIEEMIIDIGEPIARARGHTLVDVEFRGGSQPRVEVILDSPGGISVGECQQFSSLLGARLDLEEDSMPDGYYLEVSSPGLDRTLRNDREFDIFRGRMVQIRTYAPVQGQKEFLGQLEGLRDGNIVIVDEETGCSRAIAREMVSRCKLHYDIDDLM